MNEGKSCMFASSTTPCLIRRMIKQGCKNPLYTLRTKHFQPRETEALHASWLYYLPVADLKIARSSSSAGSLATVTKAI